MNGELLNANSRGNGASIDRDKLKPGLPDFEEMTTHAGFSPVRLDALRLGQ
jgi:hypothetical protein